MNQNTFHETKRRRMESRETCSEMETSQKLWEVKQVLGRDLPPKLPVVNVFAAHIQSKIASTLIRKLNKCAPLSTLGHVKRVRKVSHEDGVVELSILLCIVPPGSSEWSSSKVAPAISAIVDEHGLTPFVQEVPQYEACSRDEWKEQCQSWPTSYHPNAVKLHQLLGFEDNEVKDICRFMRVAIIQAQLGAKFGQLPNGAVIVDPGKGIIVSTGHDETGGWMDAGCAIDPGDHLQGQAGTYSSIDVNVHHRSDNKNVYSYHPLRHAVMVAIERAAEMNKKEEHENAGDTDGKLMNAKCVHINEAPDSLQKQGRVRNDQYLCTGFDAYITREPCYMCAMALLHQRVRRIFYGIPNPNVGALGGSQRLHGMEGLNHHYLVFQVSLSEKDIMGS
ncbi:hypothetical protein KP509_34G022500 [Ceratopteris richardii]|nr:hypothetical protein KP509_34G022500 [Ceratopteris richardii]